MNALKIWNQMKDLEAFKYRVDHFMNPFPAHWPGPKESAEVTSDWSPLVDIVENDLEYMIKAELPDVRKEDVKVTTDQGALTIAGERRFEKEQKENRYHRVERAYGRFSRSFALPEDARPAKVTAEFKGGVLTVHLVKDEKAKPQVLEVKVS